MFNPRRFSAGLAVLFFTLTGAGPVAAEMIGPFQTLCIATDGRQERVVAAAEKSGWRSAPDDPRAGSPRDDWTVLAFVGASPDELVGDLLVVATPSQQAVSSGINPDLSFCEIFGSQAQAAVVRDLAKLLGPGRLNDKDMYVWLFSKKDGRIVNELGLGTGKEALRAANRTRALYLVEAEADGEGRSRVSVLSLRGPPPRP